MNRLFVYGDFDWLESPLLIGQLGFESLRGSDSYSFSFDEKWLATYGNLMLSADINNMWVRSTPNLGKIFLAALVMCCPTAGDERS